MASIIKKFQPFPDPKTNVTQDKEISLWVPTQWDTKDVQNIFPVPEEWEWEALSSVISEMNITSTLCWIVPPVLQIEPIAYTVARKHGLPLVAISCNSVNLLTEYSKQIHIDFIVTTPTLKDEVLEILPTLSRQPRAIYVIHENLDTITSWNTNVLVFNEVQVIPGITLLWQNLNSVLHQGDKKFLLSSVFSWDFQKDCTSISSTAPNLKLGNIQLLPVLRKCKDGDSICL
ncbi:hypothetical protein COB52_01735 [Candidatus Kaiserbacteria bacterium]|nr:MAG: hypothetical protein COB52_01735 [Candidatus Kaiserbacteria bacterium]